MTEKLNLGGERDGLLTKMRKTGEETYFRYRNEEK